MSNGGPERFKEGVLFPTEAEADDCFKTFGSQDPFPKIDPSLLNSADIYDYVAQTGMLAPFYPWAIKSASYEASLFGPLIWWNEKNEPQYKELKEGEIFVLKANSVAFVSVEPTLRIPDYIALRFNLHIKHVHRGLLLGTGPLVDPGFVGKLVIPLHNLTDRDWPIAGGEGFIWIEFTKLSPNARWDSSVSTEGRHGKYKEFPERKKNLKFLEYLEKAARTKPVPPIRASVGEFVTKLETVQAVAKSAVDKADEIRAFVDRRFRQVEVVSLVAILVAAILGLPPILSLIQESNAYLNEARSEMGVVDRRLDRLERQLQAMQKQLESAQKDEGETRERVGRLEHPSGFRSVPSTRK
jgi:deoxycytidine triphosphate deaminase